MAGERTAWTDFRFVLTNASREAVAVTSDFFADISRDIADIKRPVNALLLPPLQAAYDGGKPVSFGPVTVSREGVEVEGRKVAWGAVQKVAVEKGRLVVTPTSGHPVKVRASTIPNIELLAVLIGLDPSGMTLSYY